MGIEAIPFLVGFIVAYGLWSLEWVNDAWAIGIFGVTVVVTAAVMLWFGLAQRGRRGGR